MKQYTATPSLGFVEALDESTRKIFQFEGRSRRSEYWWTMVVVILVNLFFTPILGFLFELATIPLKFRRLHDTGRSGWWCGFELILGALFCAFIIYDVLTCVVDVVDVAYNVEQSIEPHNVEQAIELIVFVFMRYLLVMFVLFVYKIVVFVFTCMDSDVEENEYGKSPKYVEVEASEG